MILFKTLKVVCVCKADYLFKRRNNPRVVHKAVVGGDFAAFLATACFNYNPVTDGILHPVRIKIIYFADFFKANADDFCFIAHKLPPSTAESFAQSQLWISSGIQF